MRTATTPWALGDYDRFARELFWDIGAELTAACGAGPGMRVLDVAAGTGNVALRAAEAGADVVASDLTAESLATGELRAREAGLSLDWVVADAQALPFADNEFDVVTSSFGAMFAPDHRRAAAELVRVCRPDGRIAVTTWTADGYAGDLFALSSSYVPPRRSPPRPTPVARRRRVAALFAAAGAEVAITRERVDFRFGSVPDAVATYAEQFGPFTGLRAILRPQGRWEAYLADFGGLLERYASPAGDGIAIRCDYLLITSGA